MLSHHGGAILLGTVLAAYGIPRTCLIMVGGHLSDRLSPWTVMMAADIGRLALAGSLAVLAATQHPEFLTLAPIAFGLGAGEGLFLPGSYAIMPTLVTDDDLQSGNALLSASTQLAVFAGPALGGALVAALSSAAGFGLDALSFAVSALTRRLSPRSLSFPPARTPVKAPVTADSNRPRPGFVPSSGASRWCRSSWRSTSQRTSGVPAPVKSPCRCSRVSTCMPASGHWPDHSSRPGGTVRGGLRWRPAWSSWPRFR